MGSNRESQAAGSSNNNPFRQSSTVSATDATLQEETQKLLDSEKQVASSEILSGSDNAPTPVDATSPAQPSPTAIREADREVTSSWQTQSRDQSAPISMVHHESNSAGSPEGERFLNDVEGPPPAYDSLNAPSSTASGSGLTPISTPASLEPDGPDGLPTQPEDKTAVSHLLAWIPQPPRSLQPSPRLVQPVVIPQLDVPPQRESVPFQRCYSDALAAHSVSMQDFTRFLDGLEAAQLPGSGLQGLRMFGVGVSRVPIPILGPLTGKGISALASSSSGHSGSRARLYLEQAREKYFKPRGLRLTIVKDDGLNPRLQIPSHAPRLGVLTQNTLSATCCQRRLEALEPYIAPLRFDVSEQDKQIQGVQKVARKHLQSRFKEKARRIDDLRKQQFEHTPFAAATFDEKYRNKLSEIRNAQYDLIRQSSLPGWQEKDSQFEQTREGLRLRQHELQLIISERQNQGREDTALAAEMDEVNWARRLKWLVIEGR